MSAPLGEQQLATVRAQLGDAQPAENGLVAACAKAVHDMATHDHSTQREDWFCMNLAAYMGEHAGPVLRRLLDAEAEGARLRASAEGAHRRINEVLDYLAGKDAVTLSEDAGAMGFHIVAVLDSPPRSDEEAPVRPALPWASLLTDVEASDLVQELASLFLDYWRGDRPDDVATLREVGRLLAEHRDRAARELAQVTAEVPHAAPCRYPSSPECTCKAVAS